MRWRWLPPRKPTASGRYRNDGPPSVATPLDVDWPQDATHRFLVACAVSGQASLFLLWWRGRDRQHAADLFHQWWRADRMMVNRTPSGLGPGRFELQAFIITWAQVLDGEENPGTLLPGIDEAT